MYVGMLCVLFLALTYSLETKADFTCSTDTGGTCNVVGCDKSRGPITCKRFSFFKHKCLCEEGYCANRAGICVSKARAELDYDADCDTVTGGTCNIFSCKGFRGPTECIHGQCLCKPGYCQHGGVCKKLEQTGKLLQPFCHKDTGGACLTGICHSWRGPTHCDLGHCICEPGHCSFNGICYKDEGTLNSASVVPINKKHKSFPGNHGKVKTALCLSGGGSRALAISMGILRALDNLGFMKHIDGLSSCSGGSWAAAIYMFANTPLSSLLGEATDPSLLDRATLEEAPGEMGKLLQSGTLSIAARLFAKGIAYPDFWETFVAEFILRPFGLDDKDAFMAMSDDIERIKADNPQLAQARWKSPVPERPKTFVMLGALVAPTGYMASNKSLVSLQMSPDYVGSPFYPNDGTVGYEPLPGQSFPKMRDLIVGGGLVESFAFGGKQPTQQMGGKEIKMAGPQEPFSLAKAVGISSNGPASTFTQSKMQQRLTALNAMTEYWPITSKDKPGPQNSMTYMAGDGGNLDNSAVLQMLQRKAEKLIVVTSTDLPIPSADFCSIAEDKTNGLDAMNEFIEKSKGHAGELEWTYRASFGFYNVDDVAGQFLTNNHVFRREDLAPLLCEMQTKKAAGEPVVVKRDLRVQHNPWWGIEEYDASIVFVYNEQSAMFDSLLPSETQEDLKDGKYGNYPFYSLFFEESTDPLSLSAKKVNLLAAHSEYAIKQNAALLQELLGVDNTEMAQNLNLFQGMSNASSSSTCTTVALLSILPMCVVAFVAARYRRDNVNIPKEPLLG